MEEAYPGKEGPEVSCRVLLGAMGNKSWTSDTGKGQMKNTTC